MKLETKLNKILNSEHTPKVKALKLYSVAFTLVPGSEQQNRVRLLAEKIIKDNNVIF